MAQRNFQCNATGLPCIEPRCKKTYCILEHEYNRHTAARDAAKMPPLKDAEKVARDWFRWSGKRPTEAQLRKATRHPKVIAEAKRRAAVLSTWLYRNSS